MGAKSSEAVDGFMKEGVMLIKGRREKVYSKWIWGTPARTFLSMVGADHVGVRAELPREAPAPTGRDRDRATAPGRG